MENDDQEDREYLEEYERINGANDKNKSENEEDDDEYANDEEFDESPRPKVSS